MEVPIKKVVIGMQARSGSSRFPNKIFEKIGHQTMYEMVLDRCLWSASQINKESARSRDPIEVEVALCVPEKDPILHHYRGPLTIIEGSETDVLSRYQALAERKSPDFICRITADCPLIPPHIITSQIRRIVSGKLDYYSNVDERCRTTIDGFDCEVFSPRMLEWALANSSEPQEREHVTLAMRMKPPLWARRSIAMGFVDLSDLKYSVDTQEDLDRVRHQHSLIEEKFRIAEQLYGKGNVQRFS